MGVDFRLINRLGEQRLKDIDGRYRSLYNDKVHRKFRSLNINPYCPKPNEPDDAGTYPIKACQ